MIQNFVDEYSRGRTPIPCVRCNSFTKFRDLLAHADALDCDLTRHRPLRDRPRRRAVPRARPRQGPELLPLGHRSGGGRADADPGRWPHQGGDPCASPGSSAWRPPTSPSRWRSASSRTTTTSACWSSTSRATRPRCTPGPLVSTTGEVVGKHDGFARYTIGQRKGLPGGAAEPRYVVAIRPETPRSGRGWTRGSRWAIGSALEEINWLAEPLHRGRCRARCRSAIGPAPCRPPSWPQARRAADPGSRARPVRAITPGQSGVLYAARGQVLGGGVIA